MADKKANIFFLFLLILAVIALFGVATYFLFTSSQLADSPTQITGNAPQVAQIDTTGWSTYNDANNGITFKYPTGFNSKYASLQATPMAVVVPQGNSNVDGSGCFIINPQVPNKDSQITINGMSFCLSTASDPGAGQLYNTSDYTTLRNGNYVMLQYVVHTPNGCSPYVGTPDQQPCTDFLNSYDANVTQVIQNSVSTLQFTK